MNILSSFLKSNGSSQQKIKAHNITLLFNLIRSSMPTSRAALAEQTGLSPTTVSILVEELIDRKWVRETGVGDSSMRGRKPIMLEVNAEGGCIATVEIVSSGCICSLYDICFKKLGSVHIRKLPYSSNAITEEIKTLLKAKRVLLYRLIGIQLVFPGIFDQETGDLKFSVVVPADALHEYNLVSGLKKQFPKARVLICNNTTLLAYMEFASEDNAPGKRLLAVNIDEGISAGVVTWDSRRETCQCFSLEFGHIIVDQHGKMCKCQNRGCLETICSIAALFRSLNERAGLSLEFDDTFGAEINESAMREAAALFHAQDPRMMEIMDDYVYSFCCGLISVINLYDIQVIHIGGAISALGENFLALVRDTIATRFSLFRGAEGVVIEASRNDNLSRRRAAVMMAMDEIFANAEN
ncbi:MAG: ROK family transcriptional regulator [Clostridiales bacterium]|nr:ROK family transcriptional regulator [Clostridiales bacterium]